MSTYHLPDDVAHHLTAGVSPDEAVAVLYHYDSPRGLPEPGSFVQALVTAIARADQRNRIRLSLGFTGYVAAVQLIEGHPDGLARLRAIAGVGPTHPRQTLQDVENREAYEDPRQAWAEDGT